MSGNSGKGVRNLVVELLEDQLGDSLKCVLLYGSRARGTASEDSDWDLFVVARDIPEGRVDRYGFFKDIKSTVFRGTGENIQIEAYTPEEAERVPPQQLLYGVLTGYEVLEGEEYWNSLLEKLKPAIQEEDPVLYQEGERWEIAQMI